MRTSHFKTHGWSAALVVAALAAGCGGSTINLFPDVAVGEDGGADAAPSDMTPPPDDVARPDVPSPPDASADGGSGRCASNADCRSDQFCAGMGCGTAGTCQTRPQACPGIFSPVCGCDGRTYASAECEANSNGVRVASRGACGGADASVDAPDVGRDAGPDAGPSACRSNADCGASQYCAGTGCGTAGTCAPRPMACPDLFSPTCGCDGRTYGNPCEAAGNGQRVASAGACPGGSFCAVALCMAGMRCCETTRMCQPAGVLCPAPTDAGVDAAPDVVTTGCGSNADCRPTQYCAGTGCGTRGTCADRPTACIALFAPVCGCDGMTYSNECVANAAGQRAASRGACTTVDAGVDAGSTTRCNATSDCGRGQECVFQPSACARDGFCMAAIACLIPNTYCSCDNVTYQGCRPDRPTQGTGACATTSFCATARCSATTFCCEAQRACIPLGTACSTTGTCRDDTQCGGTGYACCGATGRCYDVRCLACCMPSPGGCGSNADCASTQYCAGTGCGTRGACVARPEICTRELNPQCGCNGMTYSNPCVAAAAGVRVASAGACM
jgi:hypothetical protein